MINLNFQAKHEFLFNIQYSLRIKNRALIFLHYILNVCCGVVSQLSLLILMNTHCFGTDENYLKMHLVCSQHLKSNSKSNDSRLNHRPWRAFDILVFHQ